MTEFMHHDQVATPRSRRAIVKGAAWSIPVIAAAVAAPAASASTTAFTLTLSEDAVTGASCDVLSGLTATLQNNGQPAAGESVAITLPPNFAWSDGSKDVRSFITDSAGQITLDAIKVGGAAGNANIVATHSSSATDITAVTVMTLSDALTKNGTLYEEYPMIPAGSTTVGPGSFITPAGELYIRGTLMASGVTSAVGDHKSFDHFSVSWVDAAGAHTYESGATQNLTAPPATATAVGVHLFLGPGNALFEGDNVLDTNVTSAHAARNETDHNVKTWMTSDDGAWMKIGQNAAVKLANHPPRIQVVGPRTFFDPANGTISLVAANGTITQIESGARDVRSEFNINGQVVITWIDAAGNLAFRTGAANDGGTIIRTSGFPRTATSKVVGPGVCLEANGDLYNMDGLIATNVTSSYAVRDSQDKLSTTYIRNGNVCTF
ncbi:hypothetical protein ART_4055 [Arthrobacter sp. PAMC 25486]|uniref:hypothetical protein n=1 Tax=Arthrobacter sp. PAMC 25486 TaxID=1494608 RepID=UPI0005361770|nr:hypothetical protein [Arthrobacter sp. PAMC 25486]AIY03654.1 hypothetical protein ART_4055 [Arthrobacter sp. PAMC 25486]